MGHVIDGTRKINGTRMATRGNGLVAEVCPGGCGDRGAVEVEGRGLEILGVWGRRGATDGG